MFFNKEVVPPAQNNVNGIEVILLFIVTSFLQLYFETISCSHGGVAYLVSSLLLREKMK
jgi:hypothetical protein